MVRGELIVPSVCLVFPFIKYVSDSMGFDSSLQLFLICVWETGNSSTFSFKNVGTWLTCHPQGEQGSSVLKTFYL